MMADAAKASAAAGIIGRQCLARRARLLSRVITRIYDEALRPVDLKATQLTILVAISAAKRARPATLYRRLELEQSTFSRNIALMKRRGWVAARRGKDERSQELRVTKKGEALLAAALPRWREAQRKTTRILRATGVRALLDLVDESLLSDDGLGGDQEDEDQAAQNR